MPEMAKTVQRQSACAEEARKYLMKNAEECTFYVALGKTYRRELAERHGLTEDNVMGILSQEACRLVDEIRSL